MNKLFLTILLFLNFAITNGQNTIDKTIKSKGDSVLKIWVGKGLERIDVKFKEAYHESNDYRAIYSVTLPDNNYSEDMVIYFDKEFNVVDSNFFRTFPDYVLEDRPNDLISKDSALSLAKTSGLCLDNILDVSFYRLYHSTEFVWIFRTDNKAERLAAKKQRAKKRNTKGCRTRLINAKTGSTVNDS